MRNLSLRNYENYHLNDLEFGEVYCQNRQNIYVYSKGHVLRYEINEGATRFELCNLIETLYPVLEDDDIPKAVRITYSYEKDYLYLFLFNGDIVSIDLNSKASDVIGSVDNGIIAAEWSPEQELMTIITGAYTVLLMSNDFDPICEVNLHGGGFGEKQFITVGWGKKETQFRGSEGKLVAKDKNKEEVLINGNDDGVVRISWRGDSEYFAVSSINPETNLRYLRIFNKEAVLQFTSEPLTGLEHSLHWRPSGNIIASSQKFPNKYNIIFFEKNGLKHGEFTLPFGLDEVIVKNLLWNEDSKLLAVVLKKINEDLIQIYSVNNYHWYCKYTICFKEKNEVLSVEWDQRNNNTFHVIHKNNNSIYYSKYSWSWVVNKSKGHDKSDEAFVGVIDGCNLLLTSFKNGIVPPPMCSYSIQMPTFINQIEFAVSLSNSNNLLVHLSDGTIMTYKYEEPKKLSHELFGKFNFNEDGLYFNVNWISDDKLIISKVKNSKPHLSFVELSATESGIGWNESEIQIESAVSVIRPFTNSLILIHDSKGQLYSFDLDKKVKINTYDHLYPKNRINLNDIEIAKTKNEFVIFGLDNNNKFYLNDNIVANNITSFHIHGEFILLTTLKHQLLCLNIENDLNKIFDDNNLGDICTRRIETGSRIVTSIPNDTKVILQMPRGNLECIQPRALSFFIIGKYLDSLNYYEAFDIMRKQRINLNLIYDHNPNLFSSNVLKFIDQIKDQSWISLFLSELSNEDVTKTMYSVIYNRKSTKNESESKIKKICDLIEKTLKEKANSDEYLLPILTTYIKQGEVSHIEKALSVVKTVKENESSNIKQGVSFNEAFRYMLYLIDVEELYKVALGMYDFDLVLLVAEKSQKDPKEYLPFLNDLRKLEINYQKYTIDKYLKRYEKALKHLMQCDGDEFFNECLNFIKTHKLYRPALKLVPNTTDRYKQICSAYASELMNDHLYEEAGIMFSNAKLHANAIKAYRKSGNWEEAIACARQTLSEQELIDFFRSVAVELIEIKKFKEAATVYLDYLKNLDEAIITLCLGRQFTEAYRLADLFQNSRIIQTHIKPGIVAHFHVLKMQIANFRELFSKQKDRLAIVREEKSKPLPDVELGPGEHDMFSETSTITTHSHTGSRTSNRTFRSSKNKRKQERKMLSLKEGSPFEDLALITSLHNIVSNCVEMKEEIKQLNKCLIKIKEEEKAEELQKIFGDLLKDIENGKSDIWNAELITGKQGYGPDATSNSIAAMHTKSESLPQTPLLQPKYLVPPDMNSNFKWELEILK